MRGLIFLLLSLGLCGCAATGGNANKMGSVSMGMSKVDVVKAIGKPVSVAAKEGTEYLNYKLYETSGDWFVGKPTDYYVCFREGKVISYGRTGDFDSTKDPTQVIKIVGDIKSDEKIKVRTEDSRELENKLKTLNQLLVDGLITKNEFEEQKKKLLNDYTGK